MSDTDAADYIQPSQEFTEHGEVTIIGHPIEGGGWVEHPSMTVNFDPASLSGIFKPTRLGTVLVTGGTGSFGHAFVRRVLKEENLVERVIVFSRGEVKQARMKAKFDDDRLRFYIGDVRDRRALRKALRGVDTCIHAAALKRVDLSALNIIEFKRTIVDGVENVVDVCHQQGVEKLVCLSTDKAVEPTTPYGACKALAEWIATAGNVYGDCRIASVRYGNVVGSRGSVLAVWDRQDERGEPLTVTDERMTRFWLTIEQAVELVMFALEHMGGGEIFVPKDVERSSVVDFARQYFNDPEFVFTGKRSYEKIHERLVAKEEADRVVDVGKAYVVLPEHVRWWPGPYGQDEGEPVSDDFEYRSDRDDTGV